MGQLTGSIAHELNQPLTGILSNAQAAELMIDTGQLDYDGIAEILAGIVAEHLDTGNRVYLEGRLRTRSYDDEGVTNYATEIVADQLIMPLALAAGGTFRTMPLTLHTKTQIELVPMFLDTAIRCSEEGDSVRVYVERTA